VIVVADTSPFNYLIQLGRAGILSTIYGRVIIPPAVHAELQHRDTPSVVRLWVANLPEWVEVRSVPSLDESLPEQLGAGEREAISLAVDLKAILLIDELDGRHEAEVRQVLITGTLAVLLQASLQENLDFDTDLKRLRELGFRFSIALQESMMRRYKYLKKEPF
jgi:predicted nucleic acid-binding protein